MHVFLTAGKQSSSTPSWAGNEGALTLTLTVLHGEFALDLPQTDRMVHVKRSLDILIVERSNTSLLKHWCRSVKGIWGLCEATLGSNSKKNSNSIPKGMGKWTKLLMLKGWQIAQPCHSPASMALSCRSYGNNAYSESRGQWHSTYFACIRSQIQSFILPIKKEKRLQEPCLRPWKVLSGQMDKIGLKVQTWYVSFICQEVSPFL